jgi:tetratricopeptide (TPR) repeat protein
MKQRPVVVKLGYVPHPQILKMFSADHDLALAEAAVIKVLFYYGTLVEKFAENVIVRPEYQNMYRTLVAAAKLDPYNMDIYYFAQSAFTWELGRIAEVNELLAEGMKFRTWDPSLPFYIGFNYAYFNKNYAAAAQYMQIAAERSGNPLYTQLAARYFYESKQTDLGALFLKTMIEQTKNKAVKKTYQIRLDALMAIKVIEDALEKFRKRRGKWPLRIDQLVAEGELDKLPVDPYGGEFFIDEVGRVRSTSKLAGSGM